MLDFLFKRKTVARLEQQAAELRDRVVMLAGMYDRLKRENEQHRMLVTALRDVNASLDARCNDLEKGRP